MALLQSTTINMRSKIFDIHIRGNGPQIREILEKIKNEVAVLDPSKFFDLMRELEVSYEQREDMRRKIHGSGYKLYDTLEIGLQDWVRRTSTKATLRNLIEHLRRSEINNIADTLNQHFFPETSTTSTGPDVPQDQRGDLESGLYEEFRIDGETDKLNQSNSGSDSKPPQNKAQKTNVKLTYASLVSMLLSLFLLVYLCIKIPNANENFRQSLETPVNFSNPKYGVVSSHDSNIKIEEHNETIITLLDDPKAHLSRTDTELSIKNRHELDEFFDPTNFWKNLITLELDNTFGLICPRDRNSNVIMKEQGNNKNPLPKLDHLILNFPTYCEDLVDKILKYFNKNQFHVLEFRGEVNDDNIPQIQQLLHLNAESLESFHIIGLLRSSVNVFEIRNTFVLTSVKNIGIKLDEIWDTSLGQNVVNSRFCSIFPELTNFETKHVLFTLDNFLKFEECRKLETMHVKIKVGGNDISRIEEIDWKDRFPSLKAITIRLEFDVCPDFAVLKKMMTNFDVFHFYKFCSNCEMSSKRPQLCHFKTQRG